MDHLNFQNKLDKLCFYCVIRQKETKEKSGRKSEPNEKGVEKRNWVYRVWENIKKVLTLQVLIAWNSLLRLKLMMKQKGKLNTTAVISVCQLLDASTAQ